MIIARLDWSFSLHVFWFFKCDFLEKINASWPKSSEEIVDIVYKAFGDIVDHISIIQISLAALGFCVCVPQQVGCQDNT